MKQKTEIQESKKGTKKQFAMPKEFNIKPSRKMKKMPVNEVKLASYKH